MRRLAWLPVWVMLAAVAGCEQTDSKAETDAPVELPPDPVEFCESLARATYRSDDSLRVGVDSAGRPVVSHLYVRFRGKTFSWDHESGVDEGPFTCKDWKIIARGSRRVVAASYNPESGVLTWAGRAYRLME